MTTASTAASGHRIEPGGRAGLVLSAADATGRLLTSTVGRASTAARQTFVDPKLEHAMRLFAAVACLAVFPLAAPRSLAVSPTVDFHAGFDPPALSLNQGAEIVEEALRLTDTASGSQSRSAFYKRRLSAERFVTRFVYRVTQVGSARTGGAAFILQAQGPDAVAPPSHLSTEANAGVRPSVALRIGLRGSLALHTHPADGRSTTIKNESLKPEMHHFVDGHRYEFVLAYDGATLHLIVTDLETDDTFYLHYNELDLPALLGDREAWYGFGASTGSKPERRSVQEITGWTYFGPDDGLPPIAAFTVNGLSPYQAPQGNRLHARAPFDVRFDAGESFDVDGTVARYQWAFGDGRTVVTDDPVVEHRYDTVGRYRVRLAVVDDAGHASPARTFELLVSDDLEARIVASRTAGVAPLSVHFHALETAGLTDADFTNARFAWDFDRTHQDTDRRYEQGEGFVAGHVYEEPGTYAVELTVTDVAGRHDTERIEITVDPIDETWKTYHFASDGDDAHPGTIEQPKRTLPHALNDLAGPKVRLLFRRGDTFELDRGLTLNATGPVIVDSYTDPDAPSDARPLIQATFEDAGWSMLDLRGRDWRVMNLELRALGHDSGFGEGARDPGGIPIGGVHNLVSRVHVTEVGANVSGLNGRYGTLYEVTARRAGRYHVFGSQPRGFAIIGNDVEIESDHDEHVLRFQGGYQGYIAHNTLRAKLTKSNVQVRGQSGQIVLYDNDIVGRSSSVNPQNDASEEYQHHIVWDANRFLFEPAYAQLDSRFGAGRVAVNIRGRHVVLRNNIALNYGWLFGIGAAPWIGPARDVQVYHNTVYYDIDRGKNRGRLGNIGASFDVTVRNNLLYNAAKTGHDPWVHILSLSEAAEDLSIDHNLIQAPAWDVEKGLYSIGRRDLSLAQWRAEGFGDGSMVQQRPRFISTGPDDSRFLRLAPDSPAVDAGADVPVYTDHTGTPRPQGEARDLGAHEAPADR
jgi:PKD repeat protein